VLRLDPATRRSRKSRDALGGSAPGALAVEPFLSVQAKPDSLVTPAYYRIPRSVDECSEARRGSQKVWDDTVKFAFCRVQQRRLISGLVASSGTSDSLFLDEHSPRPDSIPRLTV